MYHDTSFMIYITKLYRVALALDSLILFKISGIKEQSGNVIYHEFSHGDVSYRSGGENVYIMLEYLLCIDY